jgi:hypothetical protein
MEVDQNNINSHKQIKRKRRSKNDQEGRMFKCECGKAYLSQLALSNHKKSKHDTADLSETSIKRGRGRPKKAVLSFKISQTMMITYSILIFFSTSFSKKNFEEKDVLKLL